MLYNSPLYFLLFIIEIFMFCQTKNMFKKMNFLIHFLRSKTFAILNFAISLRINLITPEIN